MSRPLRRAPPRRSSIASRASEAEATPRLLSGEEKRELILAHAEHHRTRPQRWGLGYAVGLVASCLVVALGWFMTLDTNLRSGLPTVADPSWNIVKDRLTELKKNASDRTQEEAAQIKRLQEQYQAAKQQAQQQDASRDARLPAGKAGSTTRQNVTTSTIPSVN